MTKLMFVSSMSDYFPRRMKTSLKSYGLTAILIFFAGAIVLAKKDLPTLGKCYDDSIITEAEILPPPCCIAPDDITVSCVDIETEELLDIRNLYSTDPEGARELLSILFGSATNEMGCATDRIVEVETEININDCGWGEVIRRFEGWSWQPEGDVNGNGVLDREEAIISENDCVQQITVIESHDYKIDFPADLDVDSVESLTFDIQLEINGCDILAVNTSEPAFLAPIGNECYKLAVTYDVINWCQWDGESDGYTVPREGGGGDNLYSLVDFTERPVIWSNNDEVIIDYDHPLPMSGEVDSLPDGHSCSVESSFCIGRWNYTQHIRVYDTSASCNASTEPCPIMYVAMASDRIRPCIEEEYQIQYCNIGGVIAENVSLEVEIDPALTVLDASISWSDQDENIYTFELDNLLPGECGNIQMNFIASCEDTTGTTYCSEVYAYPDSICTPLNPEWDGAEIELSIDCLEDSLRFNIKNIGEGNMSALQEYIVIEDNVLLYEVPPTYQLNTGETMSITHPANGFLYYMESMQPEGFPGYGVPVSWIEGCGTSFNLNEGQINQYPLGDEDSWYDVFCLELVDSYDPNDKTGYPKGFGDQKYIDQNQAIEYVINFQNEGNAEALNVEVRDSIDTNVLDINSLRIGASSHPYAWTVNENGVVVFQFEDINLPYESLNEEESKGFIQFTIQQQLDLTPGTQINNTAAIYFDSNPPIVTNETLHTIGQDYLATWIKEIPKNQEYEILVFPNPVSEQFFINIKDLAIHQALRLELYDVLGTKLMTTYFENKTTPIALEQFLTGTYLFKIYNNSNQLLGVGKVVKI